VRVGFSLFQEELAAPLGRKRKTGRWDNGQRAGEQLGRCVRHALEVTALAHRSDAQLLTAFLSRSDPTAFAPLVRRHGPFSVAPAKERRTRP